MKTEIESMAQAAAVPAATTWSVVSQVKSCRVVYFTDDVGYAPPMQGDWYYVSPYQGELPMGMTLRNCWRWRFNGHEFVDASEPKPRPQAEALLQHNKDALFMMLREKLDALRKPFAPSSLMGEHIRQAKLAEARSYLAGGTADAENGYLINTAAANACTVREMAQHIVERHEAQQRMLLRTEQLRESIASAITNAVTQADLVQVRHRLMNDVAPELTAQFPIKPEHTTPQQMATQPEPYELQQERLRLQVQLREKLNELRRPYLSRYLLDEVVVKHKGQIASAVIAAGGAVPGGLDATLLISHAASRNQTLLAAARDVLTEMNDTASVLLETEQMKDALLARIAGTQRFKDIENASRAISALRLQPSQTAQERSVP